jgi:hypothetical protein
MSSMKLSHYLGIPISDHMSQPQQQGRSHSTNFQDQAVCWVVSLLLYEAEWLPNYETPEETQGPLWVSLYQLLNCAMSLTGTGQICGKTVSDLDVTVLHSQKHLDDGNSVSH